MEHILERSTGAWRLGLYYVDLYQLHGFDPATPLDETVRALDDVVRSGKARYVGVSNWLAFRLARALGRSEIGHLVRIDSAQPRYNLLFREFERDLLPLCHEEGIGVIPYNPLAGGLLSGKHRPGAPGDGTRFTLGNAGRIYRGPLLARPGVRHGRGPPQRRPGSGDVPRHLGRRLGARQPGGDRAHRWVPAAQNRLADSVQAVGQPLGPELLALLDELTAEYRRGDAER